MKQRLAFAAALAFAALVYWPGLTGPLVLDDRANLEPLMNWLAGGVGWQTVVFDNHSGMFGRSVAMATFLANAMMTGESVFAFKLTNLLLHLVNGIAVYALLSALLRRGVLGPALIAPAINWLPVFGAALWLLHPLLVSTVLYVVQRMAMLSALFTLLTMLAYMHGRAALDMGRNREASAWLGLAAPAFTLLAVFSKESGVLAPALCGLLEWFAFAPNARRRRHPASIAFIVMVLLVPTLVAAGLTLASDPRIVGNYANRNFTLFDRLLTQPRALWSYVGAFLLPQGPGLGLYHDDFTVSRGWLSPISTIPAVVAWLLILAAGWCLRRRTPALPLGLGLYLVGQAVESSVFPLLMYFEHRVYLPSVGLVLALLGVTSFAAPHLAKRMHHARGVFATAAVAILLALGLATAARAAIWRSQQGILLQALATHPGSRWARMDAIAWDMAQSPPRMASALQHADLMMKLPEPIDRRFGALMSLSIECLSGESASPALVDKVFGTAPKTIEPDLLVGYESFAERIMREPCKDFSSADMADALVAMLDRVHLPPTHRSVWRLRFKAAKLYLAAGRPEKALEQARIAWTRHAADAPVPMLIAALLLQQGRPAEAMHLLDQADARIDAEDATGRKMLQQYRREARMMQQLSKPQPRE
jgi:hypothetical protein